MSFGSAKLECHAFSLNMLGGRPARLLVFQLGEELGEKCVDASGAAALVVSSESRAEKQTKLVHHSLGSAAVQCYAGGGPDHGSSRKGLL